MTQHRSSRRADSHRLKRPRYPLLHALMRALLMVAIERLLLKEPERRSAWLAGAEQARIEHLTIEVDNLDETMCALSDLGVRSLCFTFTARRVRDAQIELTRQGLRHRRLQPEYQRNQHSETHQAPLEPWLQHGTPAGLLPGQLFEAFRWSETRLVTKTAEISMPGNRYKVNPALAGRRVEIRFEPEDLCRVEVWHEGLSYGLAEPVKITRHAHAKLGPPAPTGDASPSAPLSSSSYLAQLQQRYERETFAELDYRPATQKEQP